MTCKNCNAEITENVKFCPNCGTKVEQASEDLTAEADAQEKEETSEVVSPFDEVTENSEANEQPEQEKIADDVLFSAYSFANTDGKYLVLTDFDIEDGNGTLVCIDGDKQYEIDSNVENIDNGNLFYQYDLFHGFDGM